MKLNKDGSFIVDVGEIFTINGEPVAINRHGELTQEIQEPTEENEPTEEERSSS